MQTNIFKYLVNRFNAPKYQNTDFQYFPLYILKFPLRWSRAPMYKRQISARRALGKNNRTFAFWGRILGPTTVFFGFLEFFWTIFF